MKTITFTDKEAKAVYKNAPASLKETLQNAYGTSFFSSKVKITDRVKTFEDAGAELNMALPELSGTDDEIAYVKLKIIATALNEGWTPDWSDSSQYKYVPWFDMSSPSELVFNDCCNWCTNSDVGSRLCFKSRELAEYAGKQFLNIYQDFMLIK